MILAVVCGAVALAGGAWRYISARQESSERAADEWIRARYGEEGELAVAARKAYKETEGDQAAKQAAMDAVYDAYEAAQAAKKAKLAQAALDALPATTLVDSTSTPSQADERRRVAFLDGKISLIPPAGWKDMGTEGHGGLAVYGLWEDGQDVTDDSTMQIVEFPRNLRDPVGAIEKQFSAMGEDFSVLQKGVITVDGHRAILLAMQYTAVITPTSSMKMRIVDCVIYGEGFALAVELTSSPKMYDRDRAALESVIRSVRMP